MPLKIFHYLSKNLKQKTDILVQPYSAVLTPGHEKNVYTRDKVFMNGPSRIRGK